MSYVQLPPTLLPTSILEKLAAALTPEELKAVLSMTDKPETKIEETPAQTYERLEQKYQHLHGVEISSVQVKG